MPTITVYRPDVETQSSAATVSPRCVRRAGLRITVVENGKPRARQILTAVAEQLRPHLPGLEIRVIGKPSASWPIADEVARTIAESSDIVLTGLGDCGGCSANSLADAVAVEQAGVPATALITEAFEGLVASYATRLGAPGYPVAVVPHPVASRTEEELQAIAAKVAPAVLDLLTTSAE